MTPAQTIEKFFEGTSFLVHGKSYHSELPAIVKDYYCYTSDGGHSILCLLEKIIRYDVPASELWRQLCPVPVKAVLRKYRIQGGFVVVDVPYSEEIGLQANPEDDEF
jgi:hypothetical protein